MCSREEAKDFIQAAVDRAVRDLRYRWAGPQQDEAVANGADPTGLASVGAAETSTGNGRRGARVARDSAK